MYLTYAEVHALLDQSQASSKNPWGVEMAFFLFYTGCRLKELTSVRVCDIHWAEKRVIINGTKSGRARRQVPLWPALEAVLRHSLALKPRPADGLLFPGRDGKRMTRLRGTLASAAKRAGITKKRGHHIARHAYASARQQMVEVDALGVERPISNEYIAQEIGHANAEMVRLVYGHLPRSGKRQTILHWGEADPRDRMTAYWEKRQKLVQRKVRAGERREHR